MRKKLFLIGIVALVVSIYGFLNAGVFLSAPAQPPKAADVMVILGGDAGARTLKGIDIYKIGFVQRIVLTGLDEGEPGAQRYYINWRSRMMIDAGVPQQALEFDAVSRNSFEEAQNTLNRARLAGWKTVLVVSDPPHMLRLKWVWGKVFNNTGITYVLIEAVPSWWSPRHWWKNEISTKFVVSEYIKIAYYLVAH
ncbi:MAG: YdcF family protein [Desulfobacteraceae bacterium]|nr:YdcF family protein [Desulfobacteraceae bacterium]